MTQATKHAIMLYSMLVLMFSALIFAGWSTDSWIESRTESSRLTPLRLEMTQDEWSCFGCGAKQKGHIAWNFYLPKIDSYIIICPKCKEAMDVAVTEAFIKHQMNSRRGDKK